MNAETPGTRRLVRGLLDGRYADAEEVVLVVDDPNARTPGSPFEASPPAAAERAVELWRTTSAPSRVK